MSTTQRAIHTYARGCTHAEALEDLPTPSVAAILRRRLDLGTEERCPLPLTTLCPDQATCEHTYANTIMTR
jgi:hypothetical protein